MKKLLCVVPALLLFAMIGAPNTQADADGITWTLANVVLSDGGTLAGSFEFDSESGYDWNIVAIGGNQSIFPDFTYNPGSSTLVGFGPQELTLDGPVGLGVGGVPENRVLVLFLQYPSSPDGYSIVPLSTGNGYDSRECYNCNPYRIPISGDVIINADLETFPGTPTPEPTPIILMFLGGGLIFLMRKRFSIRLPHTA